MSPGLGKALRVLAHDRRDLDLFNLEWLLLRDYMCLNLRYSTILICCKGIVEIATDSRDGPLVAVDIYTMNHLGVVHEVKGAKIINASRMVFMLVG